MDALALIDAAADLLLGAACPGCRAPGLRLCVSCRSTLERAPAPVERATTIPVVAANPYRPLLEHLIPAYKDDGALQLTRFLGQRLALAVRMLGPPPDAVLVPVPSLPAAVRRRGFDHAGVLARSAARQLGMSSRRWLVRRRSGVDQSLLGRGERRVNVAGSMRSRGGSGQVVVLVDDLVTTGSTLNEAARALEAGGSLIWGAAVIGDVDHRNAFPLV